MKKKLLIILFIFAARGSYADPIAAVIRISYNSQRAQVVSLLLEKHCLEIMKSASFGTVDPGIISRQIEKNNCFEETCMLRFAADAQLDLVITGSVEDRGAYLNITLNSYGINEPVNSRLVCLRKIKIPMNGRLEPREYSLLCEENSAFFLAETFRTYVKKTFLNEKSGTFSTDSPRVSGRFNIYSSRSPGKPDVKGEAVIEKGTVVSYKGNISQGDFILEDFISEANRIERYYISRKQEIVFDKPSFYDTLFIMLMTPVASASMPFASPILGYYSFSDWQGLGLWTVNAAPYLYLEARGFVNTPERLRDQNRDISRDDRAINYFAWYMALAGGMSLFMDAYAHYYLSDASLFIGPQKFLGNDLTAGYLALVSNGGGFFYKGHRGWGYFYFHLNNTLLYLTLRELSVPETFNESTGGYIKGNRNTNRAVKLGAALAVSKIIEITHTILSDTDLQSGEIEEEYILPQPLFTIDEKGNEIYGVCFIYHF